MNNFILKSPFADLMVKSFELVDTTLLNPTVSDPLVMGEWLEINDITYKMKRGTGDATVPSFVFFQGQGSYDIQAIGKAPFLFLGPYEADTLVFDSTGLTSVGLPLMVTTISFGGSTIIRGLKLNDTPATKYTVGYVTRLPAYNNNYLRFMRVK